MIGFNRMLRKQKKIAISLKNLTKKYSLKHEKPTFVEQIFRRDSQEQFTALAHISLNIFTGERVGIIGKNGSGKTTLLKIISGIATAPQGQVHISGRIVSLIDLNAGFHPGLTGEENIYLNGLVIGMTRKEIKSQFEKIVEFADIGKFIDSPIYTYSEGMKLRLGFAIAVHADPDILLIDEGVAAGDQEFQAKIGKKMKQLYEKNKTILMVSHWSDYLRANCKRIIWMDKGKIYRDGGIEVLNEYEKK